MPADQHHVWGPVLHLCSDYANQNIYTQLINHLRSLGVGQRLFAAVRSEAEAGKQPPDEPPALLFDVRNMLRRRHRLLFRSKVRLVSEAVEGRGWSRECRLIHAHFLYSDGAVAWRLAKRHRVPYVVAVRNTDLFVFGRYRPDLWPLAKRILEDAAAIVFLSPAYREMLLRRLPSHLRRSVEPRTTLIPSGVGASWMAHPPPSPIRTNEVRVIYVGNFTRNKNVATIIRAVETLRQRRPARLTLIGGGGDGESMIQSMLADAPFITRHPPIHDPDALRQIVRGHDVFVMPSFKETFGVVYLEALSQGLPIIHSRGQGVAGLIQDQDISEEVDPLDVCGLAESIERLFDRGPGLAGRCVSESGRFGWVRIAETYARLYRDVVSGRTPERSPWESGEA
jgi:glycosyltransferase involved in cell wall biosynthesis